jgi:hypothetical protein
MTKFMSALLQLLLANAPKRKERKKERREEERHTKKSNVTVWCIKAYSARLPHLKFEL